MQLSRVLFRNPGTKLLALAIACATWFVLSGQRRERISERSYRIPLSIVNVPPGTMIVSPLPDAVDVRVRGAFTPLRSLEPSKLEAVVDLADAAPGEKRYPLAAGDINVPQDVEVVAISPSEIRLVLDAVADKTLPIVPETAGQPAPGAHLDEVTVEPRTARILGPAKTLARLVNIQTEPVSIEGRDAPFSETTTLASVGPGVRVREGQVVVVRVRIRPAPAPEPTARPAPVRPRKGKS
jgi:YbbR domain-containing protein